MRSYGVTNAAPWASAPAVGPAGDTYFDTTLKTLFLSDGTSWIQVQGGGSSWGTAVIGTDPNTDIAPGIYFYQGGHANFPAPIRNSPIVVQVYLSTTPTNRIWQLSIDYFGGNQFVRVRNGGIWNDWKATSLLATETSDFNNCTYPGRYQITSGVPNGPSGVSPVESGVLVVIADNNSPSITPLSNIFQTFNANTTNRSWQRSIKSGVWSPWVLISPSSTNYFMTNCSGPAAIFTTSVWTQLTWNAPYWANGMTVGAGTGLASGAIYFTQPGKYLAITNIGYWTTPGVTFGVQTRYNLYNAAGTLKQQNDTMSGSAPVANNNGGGAASIMLDIVAGDYLQIYLNPNGSSFYLDSSGAKSWVNIIPVGGAKGDAGATGPDVTLLQSNYWYGGLATPTGVLGNDVPATIGWTTQRSNGFTLASSNQRITPALAGRYLVNAELSFNGSTSASGYTRAQINHYNSAGTLLYGYQAIGPGSNVNTYTAVPVNAILDMAVGDYITVYGTIQNSTGNFNVGYCLCSVVPVGGTKGDPGATGPSGGPVPTGGAINQSIVKTGSADFAVGWANELGPVIVGGSVDYNTLTTTGLYAIAGNNTNGPGPGNGGVLTVLAYDPTYTVQTWQAADTALSPPQTWQRHGHSGTWLAWTRMDAGAAAQGVVAYRYGTLTGVSIGTSPTNIHFVSSVSLKAGRLYRMTAFCRAINNGTSVLRYQFSAIPVGTGWSLDAYTIGNGAYQNVTLSSLGTVTSDSVANIWLQATSNPSGAQVWSDGGGYMMIEDIGLNRGLQ